MEGVWPTHVEIHFVSSLAWEEFGTNWDTFCVLADMGWVWSTQVEIYYVSSQAKDFGQNILRYILFCLYFGRVLGNTCRDSFCVHAVMGGVCSTHVEIYFCPRWHGPGLLNKGWYILCRSWYGRGLFNTCLDVFCVLAGMEVVWLTNVEIHFVHSQSWST